LISKNQGGTKLQRRRDGADYHLFNQLTTINRHKLQRRTQKKQQIELEDMVQQKK